jgi:hypothetical protein
MARIDAKDLASTVNGLLDKFGDQAEACLSEAVWQTAGEAVKRLKKAGDFGGTGQYKKGWSRKLTRKRLYAEATVYNRTDGSLTHLLEFGHAKQNGGRTRAFPHIAPINDEVPDIFVDKFTDLLAEQLIKG